MEITDQIRQAANIIDIVSQYTTLRRRGRKHVGLCPFHPEKDPSFTVDDEKQLYHCFGCGAGGDIFTLVMEKENLSFPEALKYLAQKYNIPLPERTKQSPQSLKEKEKIYKINEDTLAFFRKNLFKTKEGQRALDYLKGRKISEEIIHKLKIGYAMNSWDSLLKFFGEKKAPPKLLEKSGLVLYNDKKNSYYDRFRGRIIFPIFTETGKVVAFGGRTIFSAEPKYLNSPDTPIYSKGNLLYGLNFCKESIREKGEVILVEGYTDFVSLYQNGITNIAASLGTSLTPAQVNLAHRFAQKILLNYDSDSAGIVANSRGISLCWEQGKSPDILFLPENFDPDSYLQKYGINQYIDIIKNGRIPLIKFLIELDTPNYLNESPEEKTNIAVRIMGKILINPNTLHGSAYLKQLSEHLNLEEQVIRDSINVKHKSSETEEKKHFLPAERRLLQILIEEKLIARYVFAEMKEEDFLGLKSAPIFSVLSDLFEEGKLLNRHEVIQKINSSLRSSLSEALLENGQVPSTEEAFECLSALKQVSLENRSKELKAEIIKAERRGEKEKLRSLVHKRNDIIKQLSSLSKRNYQNLSNNNRDGTIKERS